MTVQEIEDRRRQLVEEFKLGANCKELAYKYNLSVGYVQQLTRRILRKEES